MNNKTIETVLIGFAVEQLLEKECFRTPNEPCASNTCAYNIDKKCFYGLKELPPAQYGNGCFDYNTNLRRGEL